MKIFETYPYYHIFSIFYYKHITSETFSFVYDCWCCVNWFISQSRSEEEKKFS